MPVLRNAVTTEFVHGEAVKKDGGKPLTTSFWFPDAAFGGGGAGLFSTIEAVEEIEISRYLVGVSAYARASKELGARMCGEALGVEAEHRALARLAQDKLGKDVGVLNDRGFQNFGPHRRRPAPRWRRSASASARPAVRPGACTSTAQ